MKEKKSVYKLTNELKSDLILEKRLMSLLAKNLKKWAKELSKLDDENKQTLIEKLVKAGYTFNVDDPEKMSISFVSQAGIPSRKIKKLKSGTKAVSVLKEDKPKSRKYKEILNLKEDEKYLEEKDEEKILNEIDDEDLDEDIDSNINKSQYGSYDDVDEDLREYRSNMFNNMDDDGEIVE